MVTRQQFLCYALGLCVRGKTKLAVCLVHHKIARGGILVCFRTASPKYTYRLMFVFCLLCYEVSLKEDVVAHKLRVWPDARVKPTSTACLTTLATTVVEAQTYSSSIPTLVCPPWHEKAMQLMMCVAQSDVETVSGLLRPACWFFRTEQHVFVV